MKNFINKIILASSSARRKLLMRQAGYSFEIAPSNAQEVSQKDCPSPIELTKKNAFLKAQDVAEKYPDRLVLGADTIVALGSCIFGKPRDLAQAEEFLQALQGKVHSVFTAVAFVKIDEKICDISFEESKVYFKKMGNSDIKNYLKKVYVLDKAGAYAAQEFGNLIIEKIEGNFDNVMGLPMSLVEKRLLTLFKSASIFKE